jgi:hypothetical protein
VTTATPLSTVVPLPRRAADDGRRAQAAARRETPPDRYWDVFGACWRVSSAADGGG